MSTQNRLAIIVVSFNTAEMTHACLESVYQKIDRQSTCVVLVDNNSEDDSVAIIKKQFPDVYLIENGDNVGFAAANNQGFKAVDADYFLLLNSDTIVLGDVIERSLSFIEENPGVGAFGCRVLNTDFTTQKTCSGYPSLLRLLIKTLGLDRLSFVPDHYLMRNWNRGDQRDVDVISGCYLMIPATVLKKVGPLDDSFFFFGEETDWCHRCKQAGFRLVFSPVGEIIHHGGGSVKKLSYRRDILLTSGLIRLHKKHSGLLAAVLCFLILAFFNSSRALFYGVLSVLKVESAQSKFSHFLRVTLNLRDTWPV